MESSTATSAPTSTGSATIADLIGLAAERYGDHPAVKFKRGEDWIEVSYTEVGAIASEIARGLIDLGLQPGDRAAVLCNTRPEWTYASFGIASAGGVVVPIYPTNSPEECEWVAGNSESRFLFAEDAEQAAKIAEVRDRLPNLEAVIVMVGDAPDAIRMDDLRERGRGRDHAEVERDQLDQQRERVGERQVQVDDIALVEDRLLLAHRDHRPVVAVQQHAALRRPGGAGGVDERVRVLGLDRRGARGDLGVVAAASALAQVVHADRVGRVADHHDDGLEVREPVRTSAIFAACSASSANRNRDSELPATHSHSSGEFVG